MIQSIEDNVESAKNFLIQTCSQCKRKMWLEEGTVTYNGNWYHNHCWQSVTMQKETGHALGKVCR